MVTLFLGSFNQNLQFDTIFQTIPADLCKEKERAPGKESDIFVANCAGGFLLMQADEEQHWSSVKVDNRKRSQVPRVPTGSLLLKVGNYPGTHWQARRIFLMFFVAVTSGG